MVAPSPYEGVTTILKLLREDSNPMADQPNILFVSADQMRPDWTEWHDVPVRTPTLSGLLGSGVAFENAICPSPVCGPCRSCLAVGTEYDRSYVRDHHREDLPLGVSTVYEALRDEAGYYTMATGQIDLQKHSGNLGVDGKHNHVANGFSDWLNPGGKGPSANPEAGPYEHYLHEEGLLETHLEDMQNRDSEADTFPTPLPDSAYKDNWLGRQTAAMIESAPSDRPWFMQANFVGPHGPWDVTESMHDWYRDPEVEFPVPVANDDPDEGLTPAEHQEVRRNYAAMVENIDRWLGQFLNVVEERGEREETLVVFSSDHGEMLGDHGAWHKRSPYRPSVGVPLVIAGPGVENRGRTDVPATTLDLHATFRDYAGLEPDHRDSLTMRPFLEGGKHRRDVVCSGVNYWRMAFDGQYKLVRGFDPDVHWGDRYEIDTRDEEQLQQALASEPPLLFDLEADPHEIENLATREEYSETLDHLNGCISDRLVPMENTTEQAS